ncbi:MAG TPA: AraC family transcriptional regulator [Devosia sp.]
MATIISVPGPAAAREYLLERRAGFEHYEAGSRAPRHGHLSAHVSITLASGDVQDGYAGRLRLLPGDVLIQPALDRHSNATPSPRGARVLHLPWRMETEFRGVYRLHSIDAVIREAEIDPRGAAGLLAELIDNANPEALPIWDWPDLLAADLRSGYVGIDRWARAHGLARETVSRGFRRAFGVSANTFATELRARSAWLRVISGNEPLAQVAADSGFADQSHMTRAIWAITGAPPGAWRQMVTSGFLGEHHRNV